MQTNACPENPEHVIQGISSSGTLNEFTRSTSGRLGRPVLTGLVDSATLTGKRGLFGELLLGWEPNCQVGKLQIGGRRELGGRKVLTYA